MVKGPTTSSATRHSFGSAGFVCSTRHQPHLGDLRGIFWGELGLLHPSPPLLIYLGPLRCQNEELADEGNLQEGQKGGELENVLGQLSMGPPSATKPAPPKQRLYGNVGGELLAAEVLKGRPLPQPQGHASERFQVRHAVRGASNKGSLEAKLRKQVGAMLESQGGWI